MTLKFHLKGSSRVKMSLVNHSQPGSILCEVVFDLSFCLRWLPNMVTKHRVFGCFGFKPHHLQK